MGAIVLLVVKLKRLGQQNHVYDAGTRLSGILVGLDNLIMKNYNQGQKSLDRHSLFSFIHPFTALS